MEERILDAMRSYVESNICSDCTKESDFEGKCVHCYYNVDSYIYQGSDRERKLDDLRVSFRNELMAGGRVKGDR
jgi:hypothetical protein